jgi:hypothetical protein
LFQFGEFRKHVLSFIVSDYSFDIFILFLALKSTTETIGGEMEGTSPCSSSVTLAINPIINYERGKHSHGHS